MKKVQVVPVVVVLQSGSEDESIVSEMVPQGFEEMGE